MTDLTGHEFYQHDVIDLTSYPKKYRENFNSAKSNLLSSLKYPKKEKLIICIHRKWKNIKKEEYNGNYGNI